MQTAPGKDEYRPFVLRHQHIEAFQKLGEKDFVESMLSHLRTHHEESVAELSDPIVRNRIKTGMARAKRYGLLRRDHLTGYIALMFDIAPNFDEQPVIHRILKPLNVPAEARMERLSSAPTPEDWLEAVDLADPSVWEQEATGV